MALVCGYCEKEVTKRQKSSLVELFRPYRQTFWHKTCIKRFYSSWLVGYKAGRKDGL